MENPVSQSTGSPSLRYLQRRVDEFRHWIDQFENGPTNSASGSSQEDFNLISNLEAYLIEFQSLLIWENPVNSAFALSAFTCVYWLFIMWSPRLIFILALLIFCYHFYEMWTRYVWPEIRVPTSVKENWTSINPNVLSAPEILSEWAKVKKLLAHLVAEIIDLRQRSHGTFSFLTVTVLAVIYYIGKCIPGVILLYSFALILLLTPGFLLHVLPRPVLDQVIDYCNLQLFPSPKAPSSEVVIPNCESSDLCKEEEAKSAPKATAAASREGSVSRRSSISDDLSDDFEIIDAEEIELK